MNSKKHSLTLVGLPQLCIYQQLFWFSIVVVSTLIHKQHHHILLNRLTDQGSRGRTTTVTFQSVLLDAIYVL